MNNTTVRRRLNATQLFLIGLLIVGVGMALWMEQAGFNAARRSERLATGVERIRLDLAVMSGALRRGTGQPGFPRLDFALDKTARRLVNIPAHGARFRCRSIIPNLRANPKRLATGQSLLPRQVLQTIRSRCCWWTTNP